MIHGHAGHVGILAKKRLEAGTGLVAHAFDSSLYLRAGDQLFCVLSKQLPRGPLNLNASVNTFEPVAVNTQWRYEGDYLYIDSALVLSLKNTTCWSPAVPPVDTYTFEQKLSLVKEISQRQKPKSTSSIKNGITNRQAIGERALIQWLRTTTLPIPDALRNLVGCGEGLTPAGDDYLAGAIVTLNYLKLDSAKSALQEWIVRNAQGNTSDISFAHLHAACEGYASEPVHEFLCAMFATDATGQPLLDRCREVITIGHSSGWYMLHGMLAVLESSLTNSRQ